MNYDILVAHVTRKGQQYDSDAEDQGHLHRVRRILQRERVAAGEKLAVYAPFGVMGTGAVWLDATGVGPWIAEPADDGKELRPGPFGESGADLGDLGESTEGERVGSTPYEITTSYGLRRG